jgi:hypothetical protein
MSKSGPKTLGERDFSVVVVFEKAGLRLLDLQTDVELVHTWAGASASRVRAEHECLLVARREKELLRSNVVSPFDPPVV